MSDARALDGLRVLDLSTEYPGALAAMMLADHGAEVVRLVTRREVARASFASRGKTLVIADAEGADPASLEAGLALRADVIIEDCRAEDARWTRPDAPRARHTITCWIPPFAPDDPLADTPGFEGVVEAAAGLHEVPLGRKPSYTSLSLTSVTAAHYALNGVLGALIARERDGQGQRVIVPRHDAAYALLELQAMFTDSPPRQWPALQWAATPLIGAYATSDREWIYLHAGLSHHLRVLIDALGHHAPRGAHALREIVSPETLADPASIPSAAEAREIARTLARVFKSRPSDYWERALSAEGLCIATVMRPEQWLHHPHARESEQVVEVDGVLMPGVGARLSATPGRATPARVWEATEAEALWPERPQPDTPPHHRKSAPLEGVRVLDLTQVIAGPTAGRTLAELGARVHRVEHPRFHAPWVEPFHIAFNAGKTSEVIDLHTDAGRARLDALLERLRPDVILHGWRPGVAARLGLDVASVRARLPQTIVAQISAYGDVGPWGDRPGWEQTAQAATGVQATFGGDGAPELFPLPFNDLNTGLVGALAVQLGLYARQTQGVVQRVGADLSSTSTLMQARALADGDPLVLGKYKHGPHALHRFYRARDGWMFISIHPAALPIVAELPGLEELRGALGAELDVIFRRAFARHTTHTWRELFRLAGLERHVAVVPRRTPGQLLASRRAHLLGLVHRREHPRVGPVTETGSPLTLTRTPIVPPERAAHRPDLPTEDLTPRQWAERQAVGALSLVAVRVP